MAGKVRRSKREEMDFGRMCIGNPRRMSSKNILAAVWRMDNRGATGETGRRVRR